MTGIQLAISGKPINNKIHSCFDRFFSANPKLINLLSAKWNMSKLKKPGHDQRQTKFGAYSTWFFPSPFFKIATSLFKNISEFNKKKM